MELAYFFKQSIAF